VPRRGAVGTPKTIWKYGFDAVGNLTSSTGGVSTTTFTYDALNRQISSAANLGVVGVVAFDSQYDTNGNRTLLKATIAGTADFQNVYKYDELNRLIDLKQSSQSGGNAVAFKQVGLSYNDANQLTLVNRFKHEVIHPEIDRWSLDAQNGALSKSYYSYDKTGQLTNITHSNSSASSIAQRWTYNSLHQVKTYFNSSDGTSPSTSTFTYDGSGQLTAATGAGRDGVEPIGKNRI
jgi:YD repeat-containing protein